MRDGGVLLFHLFFVDIFAIGRGLVDTLEEPSEEYCGSMRLAVDDMCDGQGTLMERYYRTDLIFDPIHPSKNGKLSWILAASYSATKPIQPYVDALVRARKGSRDLVAQTNAALEEVAAAEDIDLAALRADASAREKVAKEVRRVGYGAVPKSAGFGEDLMKGFKRFLGDVKKRLRLTGCMGSANTTAHHPQIFTGNAPMPPGPPGVVVPPAPAAAPAPAAPQTPGTGAGQTTMQTPQMQAALVAHQGAPPPNATAHQQNWGAWFGTEG